MNKIMTGAKLIVLVGVVFVLALGGWIQIYGRYSKARQSDCIIILGCSVYGTVPSPFLAARLEEGLRLYREGYASFFVVSGGQGPGEDISEAEAMKEYLESKGVDEYRVLLENESVSTYTNLEFSKNLMERHGLNSAIVVSNRYHLARASIMAKKLEIDASCSGVFVSQHKRSEMYGFLREIPALAHALLSDVILSKGK